MYCRQPGAGAARWIDVAHCGPAEFGPGLWRLEAGYRAFLVARRGWRPT